MKRGESQPLPSFGSSGTNDGFPADVSLYRNEINGQQVVGGVDSQTEMVH